MVQKRKVKKLSIKKAAKFPERAADVPVTQKMLFGVRNELKAFMKSEIHGVKSEIHGMKSEIHEIKSEVHGLKSEVHKLAVLIEEQNARNRVVLDGLTNLFTRQDRVEQQTVGFEKTLLSLSSK